MKFEDAKDVTVSDTFRTKQFTALNSAFNFLTSLFSRTLQTIVHLN